MKDRYYGWTTEQVYKDLSIEEAKRKFHRPFWHTYVSEKEISMTRRQFTEFYRRAKYFYFTSIAMAIISGLAIGFIIGVMLILARV